MDIAIVEDDPEVAGYLSVELEKAGFYVFIAKSAEEADKLVHIRPPHLVILDLNLPGKSGLDFLRNLKRREELANVFVIIISGDSDKQTVLKAISFGANDFMVKPVNVEALLLKAQKVNHLVSLRKTSTRQNPISKIDLERSLGYSMFTFWGEVTISSVLKFRNIFTDYFQRVSKKDQYVLDFRFADDIQEEHVAEVAKIVTLIKATTHKTAYILCGRHYANLTELNLDLGQLFISREDCEAGLSKVET